MPVSICALPPAKMDAPGAGTRGSAIFGGNPPPQNRKGHRPRRSNTPSPASREFQSGSRYKSADAKGPAKASRRGGSRKGIKPERNLRQHGETTGTDYSRSSARKQ